MKKRKYSVKELVIELIQVIALFVALQVYYVLFNLVLMWLF
jgi:hypothetical protein